MIHSYSGNSRCANLRCAVFDNGGAKDRRHFERKEEYIFRNYHRRQSQSNYRWIKKQCLLVLFFLFMPTSIGFAQGNIVDYFLKSPEAWEKTKILTHKEPTKIIITGGLEGLG